VIEVAMTIHRREWR